MRFTSFLHLSALSLATLTLSSSLLASFDTRNDDLFAYPDRVVSSTDLTLCGLPEEALLHVLSFLGPEDLLKCSVANLKLFNLTHEQLQSNVAKLGPGYKEQGTEADVVQSPKHLVFLLKHFSQPINYDSLSSLYKNESLIHLIDKAFSETRASFLKGVLFEIGEQEKTAWQYYLTADQEGDLFARKRVNETIYEGLLGQRERPAQERYAALEARTEDGDKDAQEWVNKAIYEGHLGQGLRPEQERYAALEARAIKGDKNAQSWVNRAIYKGRLGQDQRSEQERYAALEARARKGDKDAQNYVNEAIYEGHLGQGLRPQQERYIALIARIENGGTEAEVINAAIYKGLFGWGQRSEKERYAALEARAIKGDKNAQSRVNQVINEGLLGQQADPDISKALVQYFTFINALFLYSTKD